METGERRALAGLWCLPGVGTGTIERLRRTDGPLAQWLERPWEDLRARLSPAVQRLLGPDLELPRIADHLFHRVHRLGYRVCFPGDPAFPPGLVGLKGAPCLLFHLGPGASAGPRRSVGVVGTRRPDTGFAERAARFCSGLAARGLRIVSGAAEGIDRVAHLGCIWQGGETWAFLSCAIEQMDPGQRVLVREFEEGRATFFSEYPPGTRSNRGTFPRRNRLIAGASDAILVMRAGLKSGTLHTVAYALDYGRPVLAMPADVFNPVMQGTNLLLRQGKAIPCTDADDVVRAVGLRPESIAPPPVAERPELSQLSRLARRVYAWVGPAPEDIDVLTGRGDGAESAEVAAALVELELAGLVVQSPGRRYERLDAALRFVDGGGGSH